MNFGGISKKMKEISGLRNWLGKRIYFGRAAHFQVEAR